VVHIHKTSYILHDEKNSQILFLEGGLRHPVLASAHNFSRRPRPCFSLFSLQKRRAFLTFLSLRFAAAFFLGFCSPSDIKYEKYVLQTICLCPTKKTTGAAQGE